MTPPRSLRRHWLAVVVLIGASLSGLAAQAFQPDEVLADPVLEARARALGKELRCLVCQNQSIDDSDADLARDLRSLLRHRLAAGDSDAQARQYLVDRYGDYVLLRPPFKRTTLVLWLGPAGLLAIGLGICWLYYRRRMPAPAPDLSDAERGRLDALLRDPP